MALDEEQDKQIACLYQNMYYPLSAYALSALNDRSLAEEAVQDTFRIACAKADDLLSSPNPGGWLTNTLKYVIKNMRRSRARLNRIVIDSYLLDDSFFSDTLCQSDDNIDLMYSDVIAKEDYLLLKRIAIYRFTMLEAAEELGISVETCKKRVQRAKKKLLKIIDEK